MKTITNKYKKTARIPISDIQGISTFQGKCEFLRLLLFPANVVTFPDFPPTWLPTWKKESDDHFKEISENDTQTALYRCRNNSAAGSDGMTSTMITEPDKAIPNLLKTLFDKLLRHHVFPKIRKITKCVPIPKPNQHD